jgi:tight adherence protein C
MQTLLDMVGTYTNDPGMLQVLFVVIAAGVVLLFGLGITYLVMGASDPVRRRVGDIAPSAQEQAPVIRTSVKLQTMLGPVSEYILPKEDIERGRIVKKLVYAGYRRPDAMQIFYTIKATLAIALPLAVLVVAQWLPKLSSQLIVLYALCGAGVGLLLPNMVLDRLVENRMRKLRNAFPDALDLMVVCVEAGLGLSQTIQRVADELFVSHPELANELSMVNAEMRAGVDSVTALKHLADRTGLDDIRGLVSLLVQTLRFGTAIADSLRVYSEEFRDKRMQKAEELAAKIGTKMIFPLIVFMFPGFFVVAIGPAVIQLVGVFAQLGDMHP